MKLSRFPRIALVVGILALGLGTVFLVFVAVSRSSPEVRKARIKKTDLFVHSTLTPSLRQFRIHMGRFPTTEEGLMALVLPPKKEEDRWRGPYIMPEKVPVDPWGHEYRYRSPSMKSGHEYDLWSLGPDGVSSENDIGNWTK